MQLIRVTQNRQFVLHGQLQILRFAQDERRERDPVTKVGGDSTHLGKEASKQNSSTPRFHLSGRACGGS
jgi:hypothetical protein